MPAASRKRILVVEDDLAIARMLEKILKADYEVVVAGRLKRELGLAKIPIIFLTAKDDPLDVVRGIQVGARHYLTKPFKLEEVRDKVAKALK